MERISRREWGMVAYFFVFAAFVFLAGFFDAFYGVTAGNQENLISAGITPSSYQDIGPSALLATVLGYLGLIFAYLLYSRSTRSGNEHAQSPVNKKASLPYWFWGSIGTYVAAYVTLMWFESLGEGGIIFMIPPLILLPLLVDASTYFALPVGAVGMLYASIRYLNSSRQTSKLDIVLLLGGVAVFIFIGIYFGALF